MTTQERFEEFNELDMYANTISIIAYSQSFFCFGMKDCITNSRKLKVSKVFNN